MAGQSYILYLNGNGVNDDAAMQATPQASRMVIIFDYRQQPYIGFAGH